MYILVSNGSKRFKILILHLSKRKMSFFFNNNNKLQCPNKYLENWVEAKRKQERERERKIFAVMGG